MIKLELITDHKLGRPPIKDGEPYRVYCEFNTDTQVYELILYEFY